MEKINKHNIKEIRYICCEFTFNNWSTTYPELKIPKTSKHLIIIKKFQVSKVILDYYYSKIKYSLRNENDFTSFQKEFDFIHLDTLFNPYSIVINGVFWDKNTLCNILEDIVNETYLFNGKKISLFETLTPLFESYSEGFLEGFNKFESENINPYLNSFSDKQDFHNLVFEFINGNSTDSFLSSSNWFSSLGLSMDMKKNVNFNSGYKIGLNSGYLYKAWTIVFAHYKVFAPFFDLLDEQTSIEAKKINPTREYLDLFTNHIHSNEILNLSNRKNTNGGTNKLHYSKYAQGIEAAELKELEDVKFIDTESFARVKEYIKELSFIRRDLFRFFIKVTELDRDFNTFKKNRLGGILTERQIKENEIFDTIKSIEYLAFFVNSLITKRNMVDAVLIKRITIDRLKRLFKFFNDNFEIDLKATPFGIRITFLIDELNGLISSTDELEYLEKNTVKIVERELTQPQIAIIRAYKNEPISRDNGADVAKTYGFTAKTSGEKLYQLFNKYYNSNDRKGDEGTKRKNEEKIKLIASIIEFLPEELKGRACDEMKTLQIINNTEYS
ncbi:MAG: hypothetical protein ABNH00_08575 [Dokdonia sp.]